MPNIIVTGAGKGLGRAIAHQLLEDGARVHAVDREEAPLKKSTNPVSQAVLDWSMQMAMQASIRALIESVDAFGKEDFTADLAAVDVPTLILHGSADKPVPFELTAKRAAAAIKQSKLIEYPGATHGLLVTERDRVTHDLLEFLRA